MPRTRRWIPAVLLGVLLTAALAGWAQEEVGEEKVFAGDSGPAAIDVSEYPEEMQEQYKLYARKCSKCHTLARSINSEYRGEEWDRYVVRMSRKPSSGISPKTGEKILSFLKFHFERHDTTE